MKRERAIRHKVSRSKKVRNEIPSAHVAGQMSATYTHVTLHTHIHTLVMLPTRFLARARIPSVAQRSECPEYFGKETLLKNAYVIYSSAFIIGPHVVCLQIHVISANMSSRSIILLPLCRKVNYSSSCISLLS